MYDVKYSNDEHKIIILVSSNSGFFLNFFNKIKIDITPSPYIGSNGP